MIGLRALPLLFALLVAAPARADVSSTEIGEILGSARYRFCRDPRFRMTEREHTWCSLTSELRPVCPELPQACQQPLQPEPLSFLLNDHEGESKRGGWRSGDGERSGSRRTLRRQSAEPRGGWSPQLSFNPSGLSVIARLLFFALIAFGAVMLGRAVLQYLRSLGKQADRPQPDEPAPVESDAAAARARAAAIETDVTRLLARAREAAARGDYEQALAEAHAALLRRLDHDSLIVMHPSRTNGDYLRALIDKPELARSVQEITREIERVQFGAASATHELFRSIYDRVLPLATRAMLIVLLVLGAVGLASCRSLESAFDADEGQDTRPGGSAALLELLNRQHHRAARRTAPLEDLLPSEKKALILLRGVAIDEPLWDKLLAGVEQGGALVIAGPAALPARLGVRFVDTTATQPALAAVSEEAAEHGVRSLVAPLQHRLDLGSPRSDAQPILVRGTEVYAVQLTLGSGTLLIFADEHLFTNAALAFADNGAFIEYTLGQLKLPIELCDRWFGVGSDDPFAAVHRAELTPAILQLLFLALLFLLYKGIAFGTLRDPPARSRRAFAEHVTALGFVYARARAADHAVACYAAWALERLRERFRGGRGGLGAMATILAAQSGRSEAEVLRVLTEAQRAREAAPIPGPGLRRTGRSVPPAPLPASLPTASPANSRTPSSFSLLHELSALLHLTRDRKRKARARRP